MSLVYNNDKPIGKCESYSIDKVPGTRPLVMLTNYEPLRSELNENQQAILSWLIDCYKDDGDPIEAISDLYDETMPSAWKSCLLAAYETLNVGQKFQVLAAFAEWGMKEVAE